MYDVLTCIAYEHNIFLVLLAAFLSTTASYVGLYLLRRAHHSIAVARWVWLLTGGGVGGFGIWATHFVAMLAYDPGVVVGYEMIQTTVSLIVAIGATSLAFYTALKPQSRIAPFQAGIIFGTGVAMMHFIGMNAIVFPGHIVWQSGKVTAAIGLSIIFALPIFAISNGNKPSLLRKNLSALFSILTIVSLHFTAMSAVEIVPDFSASPVEQIIAPTALAITISAMSVLFLIFGACAAVFVKRAEAKSKKTEEIFRILVDSVKDYTLYMLDTKGNIVDWNSGAERMKGYSRDSIIGKNYSIFYPENKRTAEEFLSYLDIAATEGKYETEGWRLKSDGEKIWMHVVIEPVHDEEHTLIGFVKITRDLTEKRKIDLELRKMRDNLSLAMDHMANAICLFENSGKLIMSNRRLYEILAIGRTQSLKGCNLIDLFKFSNTLSPQQTSDFESLSANRNGSFETELQNGKILQITATIANEESWVLTIDDVTKRVRTERSIAHLARHDVLTGLPNRRHFNEILDLTLLSAAAKKSKVAVVNIDLNRFKDINDTYGHAVGDEVLCALSTLMSAALLPGETIARFGGDEFIAMKEYVDAKDLQDFLSRLESCLSNHVEIKSNMITTAASMGVAIYPTDSTDSEKLLSNADMAMYRAKESFDESICFFQNDMDEAERLRRRLAMDIWTGLEHSEFFLVYQEQRLASDHNLSGYEALLRWEHPTRGFISPEIFIPIAEECGAIRALGDWVLEKACHDLARMPALCRVAINISPLQLINLNFVDRLKEILAKSGVNPERIELEVTESTIIQDKNRALHILKQVRSMGVTVALDDFGTGYSSLETLRSFPFDKIKLDRSFVTDIDENILSQAFIRAILALGKSLNIPVLAEGVESESQMNILTQEGCDQFQGYFFGRPAVIKEL